MTCNHCGNNLDPNTEFCPNCGARKDAVSAGQTPSPAPYQNAEEQNGKTNKKVKKKQNSVSLGVSGIACAAISFIIFGWLSIAAIISGIGAIKLSLDEKKENNPKAGTGLVLGIISVAVGIVAAILYFYTLATIRIR
ncbi:MAG: zinc-ribbon domain-containing protein [Clostridiales bacterium]|jgi:hypothetical protein|nr:zinc-ribbon domain-containing protein [Clostridiales bacterium]